MQKLLRMHILYPLQQLQSDHQSRFEVESPIAESEELLEGGAEELHHHYVVVALGVRVEDLSRGAGVLGGCRGRLWSIRP